MMLQIKRLLIYSGICYIVLSSLFSKITCVNFKAKKRIVLRSASLSTDQVGKIAKKHGFKLLNKIERYGNGYVLVPKRFHSLTIKRDAIPGIEGLKYEPMVDEVFIENWKIRDPRGNLNVQSFSTQISDNSLINIRDPVFNKQWYLHNPELISPFYNLDINVLPVWSRGIDGSGITIAILDDGIDYTNSDIYSNYDRDTSYDYQDMDEDPSPPVEEKTSHGTRCASIIAGSRNNYCGIGVAYNASIAGIRMLDNKTTDTIEADGLSHKSDHIDIYSCNWGPRDDGTRFGGPGPLATKALHVGAQKGRNQLGSIYIWSSGNGGLEGDDCNADGYVTNLVTLAIGAISANGQVPLYAETCSSVIAATFSGSIGKEIGENLMINSDIGNQCKQDFQGTSSAGSIATGIIALMLQSNPSLSWRDVHHIIVETAQIVNPSDGGWKRNGAGKWFNPKYGFGRLDALEMVQTAYQWKNVDSKQTKCKIKFMKQPNTRPNLYQGGTLMLNLNATNCLSKGKDKEIVQSPNTIKKVEHIQLIVTMSHECRGRMNLVLISPSGTMSPIMKPRPKDKSSKGLQEWIFKSVHFWGESPIGQWTLVFSDSNKVDPCKLSNQSSNQLILNNLTDAYSNNKTASVMSNGNETINVAETKNSTANAILDSIHIGNTSTTLSASNSTTTEPQIEQKDFKNLYNIINNINDISQKILKLQSNNNTNEDDTAQSASSKMVPASTKSLDEEESDEDLKENDKAGSYKEKFRKLDPLNNNTKFYERILLEKVRVGPDDHKTLTKNKTYIKFNTADGNNKNVQMVSLPDKNNEADANNSADDDNDDEMEVSVTDEKKDKPRRSVTSRLKTSLIKNENVPHKRNAMKTKRSKLNSPHQYEKSGPKRSKINNTLKKIKLYSQRKKIVGSMDDLTLILYGT